MRAAILILSLAAAGCTSAPPSPTAGPTASPTASPISGQGTAAIADPFEPMNRQVHAFNVGLDAHVLRPITRTVGRGGQGAGPAPAIPDPRPGQPNTTPVQMIGNFGDNLALPGKVVNGLLQGRPQPAVQNAARFLVNTTLGLGGVFDPAGRDLALPEVDTDFGETLHVWGAPEGPYLELPVLGPSSLRDLTGRIVDAVLIDPLGPYLSGDQKTAGLVARVVSKAGERAHFGSTVDQVLHDSADSYAQTRLMYTQHRRYQLKQSEDVIDPYAD